MHLVLPQPPAFSLPLSALHLSPLLARSSHFQSRTDKSAVDFNSEAAFEVLDLCTFFAGLQTRPPSQPLLQLINIRAAKLRSS
jgi:hypothetical protein